MRDFQKARAEFIREDEYVFMHVMFLKVSNKLRKCEEPVTFDWRFDWLGKNK